MHKLHIKFLLIVYVLFFLQYKVVLNLYKDIIISKCKLCGKEYIKKHSRHYFCCAKCKRKYNESIRNNKYICNNCGKEFTTYQYKHGLSFCSHKCSAEYHSKIAKEVRKCEWCNNDFICNRSETKRFCCMKCQSMWQKYVFQDEEHKEISRSRTINMLKNGNNIVDTYAEKSNTYTKSETDQAIENAKIVDYGMVQS